MGKTKDESKSTTPNNTITLESTKVDSNAEHLLRRLKSLSEDKDAFSQAIIDLSLALHNNPIDDQSSNDGIKWLLYELAVINRLL